MTNLQRIIKYLRSRKTAATQAEICQGAKLNRNSVRRILGDSWPYDWSGVYGDDHRHMSKPTGISRDGRDRLWKYFA